MAIEKDVGLSYARNAGADLSGKLHYLAKVDTDGDIILSSAATDVVLGVITEAAVADKPVTVQYGGIGKVIVGSGGVTAGDRLTSDGSGKAINAGATALRQSFGIALESGAAGDIVPFVFRGTYLAAS